MDNIKHFIELISQGENLQAKSVLEDELSARAFEALDIKKKELASGLFGGVSEEVETNEETELNLENFSLEELEEFMVSEEFQQLDELSRKTLASYMQKTAPGKPDSVKAKLKQASDLNRKGMDLHNAGKEKKGNEMFAKAKQTVKKADNRLDARAKIMGIAGK